MDIVVSVMLMLLVWEDGRLLGEISPTGISKVRVTEAGRKGELTFGVGTGSGGQREDRGLGDLGLRQGKFRQRGQRRAQGGWERVGVCLGGHCGRVTGVGVETHVWVREGWGRARTEVSAAVERAEKGPGCERMRTLTGGEPTGTGGRQGGGVAPTRPCRDSRPTNSGIWC